jgi:pantetheine-phosphate adenylyltransferase
MKTTAVYAGSFDPVTRGHISVLTRAQLLFELVHVAVVHNPAKNPSFSSAERIDLWLTSLEELGVDQTGLSFTSLESGLLVDYCREVGAKALLKGFRTASDIEYELPMAQVNRDLAGVETLFLPAEPGTGYVSSSLVKQVSALNGDVSRYVTAAVAEKLELLKSGGNRG